MKAAKPDTPENGPAPDRGHEAAQDVSDPELVILRAKVRSFSRTVEALAAIEPQYRKTVIKAALVVLGIERPVGW
jgi:hypothetical protein